jgi:NADPH2:quinone reductase
MELNECNGLIINEFGSIKLQKCPVPKIEDNKVLVNIQYAALNPSDAMAIKGLYPSGFVLPHAGGFEASGTIVEVGKNCIAPHKVGEKVSVMGKGVYKEYCLIDSTSAFLVNEKNSMEQASCHFVNPGTVLCMEHQLKSQDKKAVIHTAGASALGKMMIRRFNQTGIVTINCVRNKKYFEEMTKLGSDYNLDMTDENFEKDLTYLCAKLEVTVCYDAVAGEMSSKLLKCMPNGSTVYVYGALSGANISNVGIGDLIFCKKSLAGFWLSEYVTKLPITDLMTMLKTIQDELQTTFKTETVVYEMKDVDKALDHINNKSSQNKAVFRISSD